MRSHRKKLAANFRTKPARRPFLAQLGLETLEARLVPAGPNLLVTEAEPNDSFAQAQAISPPTSSLLNTPYDNWLTVSGKIDPGGQVDFIPGVGLQVTGNDADFYKITKTDKPFALIVDASVPLNGSLGSPALTLYSAQKATLFETLTVNAQNQPVALAEAFSFEPGSTRKDESCLYYDLQPGTYYLKVTGVFGKAGDYNLHILTDTNYSTTIPVYNSNPAAAAQLYLDFDGHASNSDYWTKPALIGADAVPSYNLSNINFRGIGNNGNAGTYSPGEQLFIFNTWRTVAEDFVSFNINVTTVETANLVPGLGLRNVIANKDQQFLKPTAAGTAPFNAFSNGEGPSLNFVSTTPPPPAQPGDVQLINNTSILGGVGTLLSHEIGHAMGLEHQPITFADGSGLPGVMVIGSGVRGSNEKLATWVVGVNEQRQPQDDMAVIAGGANNVGFRPDDAPNTSAGAVALDMKNNAATRVGVIEKSDDVDFYSFTGAGKTTITITLLDGAFDPNLKSAVQLLDGNGNLVANSISNPDGSATVGHSNLASGKYIVRVSSTGIRSGGKPGQFIQNVGQYTLNVTTTGGPINQAPVVALPGAAVAATAKSAPLILDAGATVADADSTTLKSGKLTATITANGSADDRLSLVAGGGIEVNNAVVRFAGNIIGTVSGGSGAADPLVVTFTTDNASPLAVQALLRALAFANVSDTPTTTTRTVQVVVVDDKGAPSPAASKTVNVAAPAPAVPQMRVVANLGLTVKPNAPKNLDGAALKIITPAPAPAIVVYTITKVPTKGSLLIQRPSNLPVVMKVGDTFDQSDLDASRLSYRLNPGSTATSDSFYFTASDFAGGNIPETKFELRVSQGAAPGQNVGPFRLFGPGSSFNLFVTLGQNPTSTVLTQAKLNYTGADDSRNLIYTIVDQPEYGSLTLPQTFTQKNVQDGLQSYVASAIGNLPFGVTEDSFSFYITNTETGGITDTITFKIHFEIPNVAPAFKNGALDFYLTQTLPGENQLPVTLVRDLIGGRVAEANIANGQPVFHGIAITSVDSENGQWEVSFDRGESWTPIVEVSPNSALLVEGDDAETQLRFVPNAGFSGQATFQFRLWDETGVEESSGGFADTTQNGGSTSFSAAIGQATQFVTAEQDPSFVGGPAQTINENAGPVSVAGWASNIQDSGLGFGVSFQLVESDESDPEGLVFVQLPSLDAQGTLTFQVAPNSFGTAEFQFIPVSGGRAGAPVSLSITVQSVNQAPSFTPGPSVVISALAGPVTLVGWASNIQVGPSNEAEQSLSVELVVDNPSLFAVQPKLDLETGTLTFTPAASASGKATISINLQDDGGTANGGQNSTTRVFTITFTNQNVTFVQHLYQDLLGRTGDAAGVAFWSTMLGQGVSRGQLIANVQNSGEYFTHEASQLYSTYLRRTADAGGLANLSGLLAQGISVEQARAVLLGSTEYFQTQGGNSAAGFITALYHDVLHREADAGGASLWASMLNLGVPRVTLALGILGSAEADRLFVGDSFQALLGRSADASALDAFAKALQQGLGENRLIAALAASDEYFART